MARLDRDWERVVDLVSRDPLPVRAVRRVPSEAMASQLPLPFRRGPGKRVRDEPKTWRTEGGAIAKVCPRCKCGRDRRCTMVIGEPPDESIGVCVPAGLHGSRVCSACAARDES